MKTADLKSEDAEDISYVEKRKDKKGKLTKKETNDSSIPSAKNIEDEENVEFILMDLKNLDDLNKFKNMKSLTLIQQGIKSIEIISKCSNSSQLEYLCLNENLIQNLNSIQKFKYLKNLQLNNNQIEKLENVENLEMLETFWISENKIKIIENLPKNLKSFWIAANQIENIPDNLNQYKELNELNLAANMIIRLTEIFKLKNLKNLKVLLLNDITYGENPICIVNNFRVFVIHHLTNLKSLDLIDITNEEVQEVERTYNKKKVFYTGKIKQNNKISISLLKSLKVFKNFFTVFKCLQIMILSKKMKMLEYLKYEDQIKNNQIEEKQSKDLLYCKEKIEKCIQLIQTSHLNFIQIKTFVSEINDFQIIK